MNPRGKLQGMLTIARFNWPFYLAGTLVLLNAAAGLFVFSQPVLVVGCAAVFLAAAYFVLGSLAISHLIYDRSDLYRWGWLERALRGLHPKQAVFCHTGFDEASLALREQRTGLQWQVLDHFDEGHMTEGSIRRARALFPPTPGTLSACYSRWPLAPGSADVVFGLLAIHELRTVAERSAWFAECARCLNRGGRVILVEHLRDLANVAAFGPGAWHFHSERNWRRSWEAAGLRSLDEFRLTPFLRVFVLSAP
jgi:SAM-dependent methyltransferase